MKGSVMNKKGGILKLGNIERICYEEEERGKMKDRIYWKGMLWRKKGDTKARIYWKDMLWGRKGGY